MVITKTVLFSSLLSRLYSIDVILLSPSFSVLLHSDCCYDCYCHHHHCGTMISPSDCNTIARIIAIPFNTAFLDSLSFALLDAAVFAGELVGRSIE